MAEDCNPLDLAMAHMLGFHAFANEESMPRSLSPNAAWAWDMGFRLHQHLQLNGFIEARKRIAGI